MKITRRIVSLILAFTFVISSVNIVNAGYPNGLFGPFGPSGGGTVHGASSDLVTTGYKIQLLFLQLSDAVYKHKNDEGGEAAVLQEWNNAKMNASDAGHSGNVVQVIGEPLYLSTKHNEEAGGYVVTQGFQYGDFEYGLGDRYNSTGIVRADRKTGSNIVTTIETVGSTMASMSIPGSNLNDYMATSKYLPIYIGNAKESANVSLTDYLMYKKPVAEGNESPYIGKTSYISLINYIATEGGKYPDRAIFFDEVAVQNGSSYDIKEPEVPANATSNYTEGIYKGAKGEYRLIVTPYWAVKISGKVTALTARDMAYIAESTGEYGNGSLIYNQGPYFKGLCQIAKLERNDIFGMVPPGTWPSLTSNFARKLLYGSWGGGIAIYSSEMVWTKISTGYIGSITNVFLPGALEDDDQDINVASLEYIGDKNVEGIIEPAVTNIANSIVRSVLTGQEVLAANNMITNAPLSRDAILNGTIRLPGIDPDDVANSETEQAELIEELNALISEYGESVSTTIKDTLKNELGVDIDNPSSSPINMQDFSLAVYVLAKYGMDGVDLINGSGADVAPAATYNTPTNRARQAITLATMMSGEKSAAGIHENASGNWTGPLSITQADITETIDTDNKFATHVLDDTLNTQLQTYDYSPTGIDAAIDAGVLDVPANGGQITIPKAEYSEGMSENPDVWKKMLNPSQLQNGLLKRIPVAVGNTQLFLGAGSKLDELVKIPKGVIPTTVGATLQSLYNNYIEISEQADALQSYEGTTLKNSITCQTYTGGFIGNNSSGLQDALMLESAQLAPVTDDVNDPTHMPITYGPSLNSSYRVGTGKFNEDKSIAFNPFGINELINTTVTGLYYNYTPITDELPIKTDYRWLEKIMNPIYFSNIERDSSDPENPEGVLVAPTFIMNAVKKKYSPATAENVAQETNETLSPAKMNPSALITNDAIFDNISSDDQNYLLAMSNYYLNRGLASAETELKTTLTHDDFKTYNSTAFNGDYGISYVVYDAGIPVDIQFATEVDGKIVPLEVASDKYDHTLISNVWYAAPNVDKFVQLQKYYTLKDKNGKAHTLEVEEAVVKSATISGKDEIKDFYETYTNAYNTNNKNMFPSTGHAKGAHSDSLTQWTKRTIFEKTSEKMLNKEAYTHTHEKSKLNPAARCIVPNGDSLGMPSAIDNLSESLFNGITITPSIYDKEAYLDDPAANRLQVIVKVRTVSGLKQYNMIQGLGGDYVEEVTPNIGSDGKVIIDERIPTSTNEAVRTAVPDTPANNKNTGKQSSVFMLERDIDPNSERDDWTWEGFKNSKDDDGKYRILDKNSGLTQPETDAGWTNPPILNVGGDDENMEDELDIPSGTKAIYVRYVENPPLYEIYKKNGQPDYIYKRTKEVSAEGYIRASKGGTSDNAVMDGTPYYPVMAVAADINFDPPASNTVVEIEKLTDEDGNVTTKAKLNDPDSWEWVMKNVADFGVNSSGLSSSANPVKVAKNVTASGASTLFDVQVVGIDKLYHKLDASAEPAKQKSFPITLTQIVNGRLGTNVPDDGRGFGYSPSLTSKPEAIETYETHGPVEIRDERFPNGGPDARTTSVLKPAFEGSGTYTDGVNTSVTYPAEYVNDLPNYVIYILYVQDDTEPKATDNSFYAILPQDMVTKAVAYKDLARQYYQKIQSGSSAYDANFEKWYTLYMTIGSDKAYRIDKDGSESGHVYAGGVYRTVDFENAGHPGTGDTISFGPLSRGVNNHGQLRGRWRGWYRTVYEPEDDDEVPEPPDGFDNYDGDHVGDTMVRETTYHYKSDGSVETDTDYDFGTGWYYVPNRCAGGEGPSDTISLFDKYTVDFGIQKQSTKYYNLVGDITPDTVGITHHDFSSTANYVRNDIRLGKDTGEKYYWTDTFHYYNDYNFYITVWRGQEQVTFAHAPFESEQTDKNSKGMEQSVGAIQKSALSELNAKPINEIVTAAADGSASTTPYGFISDSLIGETAPGQTAEKPANYWKENIHEANIYMGPDITDTHDPKDGALEEYEGTKYDGFVNSYAYGFTDGDKHVDGTYLLPDYEEYPPDSDEPEWTRRYDTFSQTNLEDSGSSQIQMSASDGVKNSFTAFHGYLLIQNMIDKAGAGQAETDPGSAANTFSVNGGSYYNNRNIQFQKSKTLTIPNTWNNSTGDSVPIWVNWYPWVKMRYQTVNSEMYYTPAEGSTVTTPLRTENVYAISANQSTMKLNNAVEIGFNRGTYRDEHGEYQDYDIDPAKANRITVQSTQWSTHQNALKNVIHEPGFEDGEEGRSAKGTVLPGGAIYTLTIGAINDSSGYDAGPDAHLARSKVGIQYYKAYVPNSMMPTLVKTNRVGEHTRYANDGDAGDELDKAKARYDIYGKDVTKDPTFRGLVQATMQTINNATIALSLGDDPEAAHVEGNAYDHTDKKYKLGRGDGADGGVVTDELEVPLGNTEPTKALSGEDSAGNSASLDTLSFVQDTPIFCRVWSDTAGNVFFGWSEQTTQPTIGDLLKQNSPGNAEHGWIKVVTAGGRIEESPVHWVYDEDSKQYLYNDKTIAGGFPYKVDASTRIITNYVNATERAIGLADSASKPLRAGNAADSTHLQYNIPPDNRKADSGTYGGMRYGNEVGTIPSVSSYDNLVTGFNNQGWNVLTNELKDEIEKTIHNAPPGTGIGYKWLEYNKKGKVNGGTGYETNNKWYNEASDGFGVVLLRGIIEVGFGGPKPSSGVTGGTSANEPVRTTIIDPEWQPSHTDRSSLFTAFRSGHIYTESDSQQHFYTSISGPASGDTAPTMPGTPPPAPAAPDGSTSGGVALGVQTDNDAASRYWLYLDPEGFGYLYRSKKFFIPNGSVMDLN